MAITNRTAAAHHKSHAAGSTDRPVIAGRVMVLGDSAALVQRETKSRKDSGSVTSAGARSQTLDGIISA
jgi:hypothetical protein